MSYIPFLHPIDAVHDWSFLLLIPLSFGISVVYKALRLPTMNGFWRKVAVMTTQIVISMIALAIALTILVQVVIPNLPIE